jgi:F0F1-type ATP synthase membrane subunit a
MAINYLYLQSTHFTTGQCRNSSPWSVWLVTLCKIFATVSFFQKCNSRTRNRKTLLFIGYACKWTGKCIFAYSNEKKKNVTLFMYLDFWLFLSNWNISWYVSIKFINTKIFIKLYFWFRYKYSCIKNWS